MRIMGREGLNDALDLPRLVNDAGIQIRGRSPESAGVDAARLDAVLGNREPDL